MQRFWLDCVNRESGKQSQEIITAEDQQSAFAEVSRRGMLVAKVNHVADVPQHEQDDATNDPFASELKVRAARLKSATAGTAGMNVCGFFIALIGVLCLIRAVTLETSVQTSGAVSQFGITLGDRVNNLGLMNDRLCFVVAGSSLIVAGVVVMGLAQVVKEVFRWGHPITMRLESNATQSHDRDSV